MSGCLITLWTDSHQWVCHVGTTSDSAEVTKKVKEKFAAAMPKDITSFDPFKAWDGTEIMQKQKQIKPLGTPKILGLVTAGNLFYSLLLLHLPPTGIGFSDNWCVGGKKLVPPMTREALNLKLGGK